MMEALYLDKIESLKKQFIHRYSVILCCVFILFIIVFKFFIYNPPIVLYLIGGSLFFSYTYLLVKGKYSADQIIHGYLIIAPLYNFYIMLTFWDNSISSIVSLFPLPLAAYVFFSKKEIILYSVYLIINIVACFFVYQYFGYKFFKYSRDEVVIADVFLFGYNLLVIILLLIYNNKINKVKILADVETYKQEGSKVQNTEMINQKSIESVPVIDEGDEKLFEKLESMMENEKMFQKTNLNISMLSTSLNINYTHLSRVIRCKGYQNFSNYLNEHRINYVKTLINESNLQKVTLMYIYTEAGFSNQATFNRVFKSIEGITPSEYINRIQEENNSEKVKF
ncbi:AraC family transcriptional regulator [Chryseobacterium sp. SIMBA_029]